MFSSFLKIKEKFLNKNNKKFSGGYEGKNIQREEGMDDTEENTNIIEGMEDTENMNKNKPSIENPIEEQSNEQMNRTENRDSDMDLGETPYIYNEIEYFYLNDNKLNRMFELCNNGTKKKYTVYTCLYMMNTECIVSEKIYPFLEFIMIKTENNEFTFPSFSYECPEIQEEENSESQENIYFSNACIEHAMTLFGTDIDIHNENIDLADLYKGFLEYDETTIFSVFDMTSLSSKMKNNWVAIVDEITKKKSIYKIPIQPVITDFFTKYPYMKNIIFKHPETIIDTVDIPIQMYICQKIDDSEKYHFKNIEKKEKATTKFQEIVDQIKEKIKDEWFGSFYYFSVEPIDTNKNASLLKRYFVCPSRVHDSLFILKDILDIDDTTKAEYRERCFDSPMIYFKKNELEYYCIKSLLAFYEPSKKI